VPSTSEIAWTHWRRGAYLAVDLLGDDLGRADLKLKALTPHVLNQDTQVQGATAGQEKAVAGLLGQGSQPWNMTDSMLLNKNPLVAILGRLAEGV
jgi:hypothetical protein